MDGSCRHSKGLIIYPDWSELVDVFRGVNTVIIVNVVRIVSIVGVFENVRIIDIVKIA